MNEQKPGKTQLSLVLESPASKVTSQGATRSDNHRTVALDAGPKVVSLDGIRQKAVRAVLIGQLRKTGLID